MIKVFGIYKFFLFVCLILSPIYLCAQDLGSSNGLFRSSNPPSKTNASKSKTSTSKKTTPKKSVKSTDSKRMTRTSKTKNVKSPNTTLQTNAKPQNVYTQPVKPENDIIIKVGDATTGDFNELLEVAIDEGNNARDERDYPKAEKAYRRAQSLQPKDARAVYGLGNVYSDQQRWEEAEKAYRQAILLEPDSPAPYIALSYVLTQPVVSGNLSDRYAEAEKMARKAIQIDSNNAFAYDQLGVALELRGLISQETQNAYQKAIEIEPEFALAYAHLGRLHRRNGRTNESTEAYRKAIQFSNDVPTMILVADVMQSQQRYLDSEQLLRRALSQDPKNPTALYMLGRALTTRNSFDEAEKVLKKSVEVSPNSFVSYTLLSSLNLRRGRLDEAEKILMMAIKVVSFNERKRLAQEFETVGDAFKRIGKNQDAARLYRQAINLDSGKVSLTEKLAQTR